MTLKPTPSNPDTPAALRRIGRRRLLQALMSSGALVAANLVPATWLPPVVEVGRLPAHAQTSPPPAPPVLLTKPSLTLMDQTCLSSAGQPGYRYRIDLTYTSRSRQVESEFQVRHHFELRPSGPSGSFVKSGDELTITGDGFQGAVAYSICVAFGPQTELATTVVLIDGNDNQLGSIDFTRPKPPSALDGENEGSFVQP